MQHFLFDMIYSSRIVFVRTLGESTFWTIGAFSKAYKAFRRNMKRAFSVHWMRWSALHKSCQFRERISMVSAMQKCTILHKMIAICRRNGYESERCRAEEESMERGMSVDENQNDRRFFGVPGLLTKNKEICFSTTSWMFEVAWFSAVMKAKFNHYALKLDFVGHIGSTRRDDNSWLWLFSAPLTSFVDFSCQRLQASSWSPNYWVSTLLLFSRTRTSCLLQSNLNISSRSSISCAVAHSLQAYAIIVFCSFMSSILRGKNNGNTRRVLRRALLIGSLQQGQPVKWARVVCILYSILRRILDNLRCCFIVLNGLSCNYLMIDIFILSKVVFQG